MFHHRLYSRAKSPGDLVVFNAILIVSHIIATVTNLLYLLLHHIWHPSSNTSSIGTSVVLGSTPILGATRNK